MIFQKFGHNKAGGKLFFLLVVKNFNFDLMFLKFLAIDFLLLSGIITLPYHIGLSILNGFQDYS